MLVDVKMHFVLKSQSPVMAHINQNSVDYYAMRYSFEIDDFILNFRYDGGNDDE